MDGSRGWEVPRWGLRRPSLLARDNRQVSRARRGRRPTVTGVSSQLVPTDEGPLQGWDVDEQLKGYLAAARAPNTLKAYRSDWAEFEAWCAHAGLVPLPATPETLARYLVELAEVARTSTVGRRISSIAQAHRVAGLASPSDDPRLRAVWAGIRRVHGTAPDQAAPLTVSLLRMVIDKLPRGLGGTRDRALLLVGFAGALRRSELVASTSRTSARSPRASWSPSGAPRPTR